MNTRVAAKDHVRVGDALLEVHRVREQHEASNADGPKQSASNKLHSKDAGELSRPLRDLLEQLDRPILPFERGHRPLIEWQPAVQSLQRLPARVSVN
jgi:hypothetical protein